MDVPQSVCHNAMLTRRWCRYEKITTSRSQPEIRNQITGQCSPTCIYTQKGNDIGYLVNMGIKVQCLDAAHKMAILECHYATYSIRFPKTMMNGCNRLHYTRECDGVFFAEQVLYLGLVRSHLPNWDCLFLLHFQDGHRNHNSLMVMQSVNATWIM